MNDKELVAQHAANLVKDGMIVGLGTGSTADCFIAELALRQQQGLQVMTVASSIVSMQKAQQLGLPLIAIEHLKKLDLYVDGADEVTPENILLKGQGADLVKEKLLATVCDQFIVLVDQSKKVKRIGDRFPIPAEVIPSAWQLVKQQLVSVGGQANLRLNSNGNGLVVTSHGSLVLDVTFPKELSAQQIDSILNAMSGVVEHGVFIDLASIVLLSNKGDVQEIKSA